MYYNTAISAIFPQNNGKPAFTVTIPRDQRILTVPLSIYFFQLDFQKNYQIIFEINNLDTNKSLPNKTFEIPGQPQAILEPANSQLDYNLTFELPEDIPDKSSFSLTAILLGAQANSRSVTYFALNKKNEGVWS